MKKMKVKDKKMKVKDKKIKTWFSCVESTYKKCLREE